MPCKHKEKRVGRRKGKGVAGATQERTVEGCRGSGGGGGVALVALGSPDPTGAAAEAFTISTPGPSNMTAYCDMIGDRDMEGR